MKKFSFLFALCALLGVAFLSSCTDDTPAQAKAYHDSLYESTDSMIDYIFDFEDAVYYDESVPAVEAAHAQLMTVIASSKAAVEGKGNFKDDAAFKDACMSMINFYDDYASNAYPEILDIMSVDSLTDNDWNRIDDIVNNFYDDESEYLMDFDNASEAFKTKWETETAEAEASH